MMPVSPATIPDPNELKRLLMNDTALRSLSTTVKYVVSLPMRMSPYAGGSIAFVGIDQRAAAWRRSPSRAAP